MNQSMSFVEKLKDAKKLPNKIIIVGPTADEYKNFVESIGGVVVRIDPTSKMQNASIRC